MFVMHVASSAIAITFVFTLYMLALAACSGVMF
jgi:hypothetical protein